MNFLIHRGAHEVGGTCLELEVDGFRLLVDYGKPLPGAKEGPIPPTRGVGAVLISHGHADHHGLLESLMPNIPVHLSKVTLDLIGTTRTFRGEAPLAAPMEVFKSRRSFAVGPFTVTPLPVDHSFPDSFAFLIEAKGKRVLYSGDLRETGRKAGLTRALVPERVGPLDALFLEGTNLARPGGTQTGEADVEEAFVQSLRHNKGAAFLIASSQNTDRLVTAFRAAVRTNRTLVVDLYTAWCLETVSALSTHLSRVGWDRLKVLYNGRSARSYNRVLYRDPGLFRGFQAMAYHPAHRITEARLMENPGRYLIKMPERYIEPLALAMTPPSTVFYSQWTGYLKGDPTSAANRLKDHPKISWHEVHASGHAGADSLRRLAERLSPKRLIPIHTKNAREMMSWGLGAFMPEQGKVYGV